MAEVQTAVPPDTGRLLFEIKKVIVGQDHLLERLIVALLARGHLLVEGGARGRFDPVIAHRDRRAHALEHLGKTDVPLNARATDALDPDRAAAREPADRAGGEKIGRRGCIAFDVDLARGGVAHVWNREPRPAASRG